VIGDLLMLLFSVAAILTHSAWMAEWSSIIADRSSRHGKRASDHVQFSARVFDT